MMRGYRPGSAKPLTGKQVIILLACIAAIIIGTWLGGYWSCCDLARLG